MRPRGRRNSRRVGGGGQLERINQSAGNVSLHNADARTDLQSTLAAAADCTGRFQDRVWGRVPVTTTPAVPFLAAARRLIFRTPGGCRRRRRRRSRSYMLGRRAAGQTSCDGDVGCLGVAGMLHFTRKVMYPSPKQQGPDLIDLQRAAVIGGNGIFSLSCRYQRYYDPFEDVSAFK